MYSYVNDTGFNVINFGELSTHAVMDSTDSSSGCKNYWAMNLYKDEDCTEEVDTDGPVENLLQNEDYWERYVKVDVETEYEP